MDNEKRKASIAKRLIKYSSPIDEHGCIHWNGYSDKDGYGLLNVELENGGRLKKNEVFESLVTNKARRLFNNAK